MKKTIIKSGSVLALLCAASIASSASAQSMTMTQNTMMTNDAMANSGMMMGDMNITMNLGYGSRGDDVITLQSFLEMKNFLVMPEGVSKGYFGALTKAAVFKYQESVGISGTGYFGSLSRASMSKGMMTASAPMSHGVMVGGALMVPNLDIVANALNASNVTTVVAAVKAAGLVDTLKSAGPFTVFAPNNAAFAKLPAGTVESLVKPENKSMLVDILTYHVVAGRYTSKDLYDGEILKTVEGKNIKIGKVNGMIKINGTAVVETPDVISSNGVTFVIDGVLTPPAGVTVGGASMTPNLDIVDNALNASNVTTLVAAVKAAGLVDTLKGKGPFTVFAPTNAAFAKLSAGTVDTLVKPENKATLTDILTYHVVSGTYLAKDLYDGEMLTTVEGKKIRISKVENQITVNGSAMIETSDVISSNGVTHVISSVLMPQ